MQKVKFFFLSLTICSLCFMGCQDDQKDLLDDMDSQIHMSSPNGQTPDRQSVRSCGSTEHTAKLLENPTYKRLHEQKFERLANAVSLRDCSSPTLLPIAVHFQGVPSPDAACLRTLAQSQIDILNHDYKGTNDDISNWVANSSNYPGISNGEACVEFRIANKNHPSGYNLSNGDLAVTINQTTGDNNNDWSGYINIFVQFNTGVLGYSPLGGSGNGDGVVIDASAFGSGNGCGQIAPNAPYNLGRTLTHELGHYLLLDHIWGGGCGQDDGVSDTPNQADSNYGCPSANTASCNSTDLHMNYMDYTDDACMYMFSAGQATRMVNYVSSSLSNVVNNASNVIDGDGGGNGPTCNDGIQNGNETGVDCGGSCAPCQTEPTCNDGVQNGDETGVDCGGSCAPCQTEPTCNDGVQNGDETGVDCGGSCAPCNEPTECAAPTSSSVEQLSSSSVRVSWSTIPDAIRYRVRYREIGTSQWTTKSTVNTFKKLNGLFDGATYEYKLKTRCADYSWTPWGSTDTFTVGDDTGGGNGDCQEITLELILDDYGSETTWEVYSNNGSVVASGGSYNDNANGQFIDETFCLESGCYTFAIYDAYGDGICCDWGEGSYALVDANGDLIAASDGYFGTYEEIDFCTDANRVSRLSRKKDDKKANLPPKKK